MHIQLEATENTSIEAYSDHEVRINNQVYSHNVLISRAGIYSQQLGFRQGASKRDKGVYTEYMTDGERACNTAENSIAQSIITDRSVDSIDKLTPETLKPLISQSIAPEIILIGHNNPSKFPPPTTTDYLSKQRIALESMSIGAACRTYNVLLSEHRNIVLGIIF